MSKKFNLTDQQFINLSPRHSIKWWLLNYNNNTTITNVSIMETSKNSYECKCVTTSPRILFMVRSISSEWVSEWEKEGEEERNINTFVSCHKTWFHVIYLKISIFRANLRIVTCAVYFIIFITQRNFFHIALD